MPITSDTSHGSAPLLPRIAFVGFGEAGMALAQGWLDDFPHLEISAFDIKTSSTDAALRDAKLSDYDKCNVRGAMSLKDAIADAGLVISTVTADQAFVAASAVAEHLQPGVLFLDLNSCAPQTKQKSADVISAKGVTYVDVAVMSPIHPHRHKTPMLIAGAQAQEASDLLGNLHANTEIVGTDIGAAAAIKMIRSVFVKGLEALMIEGVLAGQKLGVTQKVLDSLNASFPNFHWSDKAGYMIERSMTHGIRRAAELQEAVVMLEGIGVGAEMSRATAARQYEVGALELDASALNEQNYAGFAQAILNSPKWRNNNEGPNDGS